jgi:ubiquinone/menaquinone biosynthesis C-methylase UbiE
MNNLLEHNRIAWNKEVQDGNIWTIPVSKEELDAAVQGDFKIVLTPFKPVPQHWLGNIKGKRILCLASGGGQQGPILAAAGGQVTVFDNSDQQLRKDEILATEYQLEITTVRGNMQDLSCFADQTFDLIVHPVSNCFIDDILPVWQESYRVLKEKGNLLSGFSNPLMYMLDWEEADQTRRCELRHAIPYSDLQSLSPSMKRKYRQERTPFEFGHSLTDQIQGQIEAGFIIAGFYEDQGEELLDQFTDIFIATRAIKISENL